MIHEAFGLWKYSSLSMACQPGKTKAQFILKKIEGKLLTEAELAACRTEPDWEPAEKLLERIKKDKLAKV